MNSTNPGEPVFRLVVQYRTPNHANARKNWLAVMREKHKAQDCVIAALRLSVKSFSTLTPNIQASKTYSTALRLLESFAATKRVKSRSKSTSAKPRRGKLKSQK